MTKKAYYFVVIIKQNRKQIKLFVIFIAEFNNCNFLYCLVQTEEKRHIYFDISQQNAIL